MRFTVTPFVILNTVLLLMVDLRTGKFLTQLFSLPPGIAMSKGRITDDIRRLRFDRSEMTQQALAEKVGVTRQR